MPENFISLDENLPLQCAPITLDETFLSDESLPWQCVESHLLDETFLLDENLPIGSVLNHI